MDKQGSALKKGICPKCGRKLVPVWLRGNRYAGCPVCPKIRTPYPISVKEMRDWGIGGI